MMAPAVGANARPMFGGWGLFDDDRMFALLAGGTLYLKADDGNRADFEERGLARLRPWPDKPMTMPYYT